MKNSPSENKEVVPSKKLEEVKIDLELLENFLSPENPPEKIENSLRGNLLSAVSRIISFIHYINRGMKKPDALFFPKDFSEITMSSLSLLQALLGSSEKSKGGDRMENEIDFTQEDWITIKKNFPETKRILLDLEGELPTEPFPIMVTLEEEMEEIKKLIKEGTE